MNTLKPLVFVAVLAAIGYGVYSRLNNAPDVPPPEASNGWEAGAQVRMPGEGSSDPGSRWANPAADAPGGLAGTLSPPPGIASAAAAQPGSPAQGGFNLPPNQSDPNAGFDPRGADGRNVDPRSTDPRNFDPRGADPRNLMPPFAGGETTPQNSLGAPANTARGAAGSLGGFAGALEVARRQLDEGEMVKGLQQLSIWYDDPRLSPIEQEELTHLLDQVSGTVIYSTRSLLEAPYEVAPGERLEEIAQKYNVSAQLLAKINGIENPNDLRPGERLKVLKGPFSAVVNLDKKQLTVMLGGIYAGRFNIGLGRELPATEGQFVVTDKVANPTYRGADRAIDGNDPANPLGERWIGLGDRLGIHGTNNPSSIGRSDLPGCISLAPRDVEDVYDILSVGSKVVIRR